MDTSEEYVLMCRGAEELRKTWTWKEGDFYAGKVHTCHNEDFNKIDWPIEYGGVCSEDHDPNYRVNCGENWYSEVWPLPRDDQLMELSGLDWDLYYHDLVKRYSEYDSAERAGLAMIMYTKYGKKWDGEKWI